MKHINEYFNTLYNLERTGIKYSLKNITDLLFKIGNPHLETKFIHIAGTNGKGGTSSFLASIMMEHGLKTGLYTSPHLLKFNERIQINGNFITNSYIKKFIDYNLNYIKKIKASFFEVTTALAFKYFADKKVDLAIIETGLGGRLEIGRAHV
jgi:dihydrofolate synthase/folylpolyglutamate synthase